MKNLFKFGFLALAISLSVAACSSNKSEEATDSTVVDTAVLDTTIAVDTVVTDTVAADSAM
ncbi:hypothetical protein WG906_02805 [Pedobacter sp. P351]|uniref:hypothetical protein n=1 Tax=Pedobacter superstes TaxID=3133441 RepID=UPI0030AFE385